MPKHTRKEARRLANPNSPFPDAEGFRPKRSRGADLERLKRARENDTTFETDEPKHFAVQGQRDRARSKTTRTGGG